MHEPSTPPTPRCLRVTKAELRLQDTDELREQLAESLRDAGHRLVLDLQDVALVDSTVLGLLIVFLRRAREAGGDIKLASVQSQVLRLLEVVRLHLVFELYDNSQQALDSFSC